MTITAPAIGGSAAQNAAPGPGSNNGMAGFVHELVDAWNSHDLERVTGFYASDYKGEDVGQPAQQIGLPGIRQMITGYWSAFPDLQFVTQEVVVDGDRVAFYWTARGTHRGRVMNIPPTGRDISMRGVSLLTLKDRRVRNAIYVWDVAGLLRSIGLLPEL